MNNSRTRRRVEQGENEDGGCAEWGSLRVPGIRLRSVRKRKGDSYLLLMTPKKKARKAIKARYATSFSTAGRPLCRKWWSKSTPRLPGGSTYFRVGNASERIQRSA